MSQKLASISVVFPGLNEEKYIGNCLEALFKQEIKPKQIIFVNNGSSDNTLKIAKSYKQKFTKKKIEYLIITEKKIGVANARNAGWSQATQPIIASTDSDCIPSPTWIKNIEEFFKNDEAVALTGKIIYYDGPKFLRLYTRIGGYKIFYLVSKIRCKFHLISTGNCAVRKEAFIKSGGFNSKIISTNDLDDVDLSSKISLIGNIKYTKDIVVFTSSRRYKGFKNALINGYQRLASMRRIRKDHKKRKRIN